MRSAGLPPMMTMVLALQDVVVTVGHRAVASKGIGYARDGVEWQMRA